MPLTDPGPSHGPSPRAWWAGVVAALAYGALGALAGAFAGSRGPPVPAIVAAFQTGIIIADAATAMLLLAEAQERRERWLGLIGAAYVWSAIYAVFHLLTFPGALLPDATVIGTPKLTSYVFNTWRIGYIALILVGCLAVASPKRASPRSVAGVVGIAGLAAIAAFGALLLAEPHLPQLVVAQDFTAFNLLLSWVGVPLGLFACALCWRRGRADSLQLWLAVALTSWCGDLAISNIAGGRFTLGWYFGRTSGVLSACTLFLFFLFRSIAQQKAALRAARVLRERTISLQLEIARRADAEQQVAQLQKLDAIGQLTGGVAHDFNNLLAAIMGNLDLLRGSTAGLGPRVQRWVESALAAAERGRNLTNQLLVFARAQRLEMKALNLDAALARIRDLLERTLGPNIVVEMPTPGDVPCVVGDETQLELAILNIAINARDAMPAGGRLVIEVAPYRAQGDAEMADGDYVEIGVSDTGPGMSADVLARAFDPFFTTKPTGQGTGLGLSQVYGFARKAGGKARIESAPGRGTRVLVYLPMASGHDEHPVWTNAPAERSRAVEGRVLVVDDDAEVRGFLVDYLEELGLQTANAADGFDALAQLARARPDLLIADFAMPNMNGAELVARARALYPDLPVIVASGYAESAQLEATPGSPPLLLRKPFRGHELQAAVAEALRTARAD